MRSLVSSEASLIEAISSVSSWIDKALRRSGRFRVMTVICGVFFSTRTTGIFLRLQRRKPRASALFCQQFSVMDAVKIIECPGDAWHGPKHQIPTLLNVEYLRGLLDAG